MVVLMQRIEEFETHQKKTMEYVEKRQEETKKELEKVAAQEPRVEPSRKPPVRVELSGRLNQAFLYADNGEDSQISSSTTTTRVRALASVVRRT